MVWSLLIIGVLLAVLMGIVIHIGNLVSAQLRMMTQHLQTLASQEQPQQALLRDLMQDVGAEIFAVNRAICESNGHLARLVTEFQRLHEATRAIEAMEHAMANIQNAVTDVQDAVRLAHAHHNALVSLLHEMMGHLSEAQEIKQELEEIKRVVCEGWEFVTMSEQERHERRERELFDQAEPLTRAYFQQLEPGTILHLVSLSFYYPATFPIFNRFEYKHDHLDEQAHSEFGYAVHGFQRNSISEEWTPYQFLTTETESNTSDCAGEIRIDRKSFLEYKGI